jgi:hypothetical protein
LPGKDKTKKNKKDLFRKRKKKENNAGFTKQKKKAGSC